MRCGISTVALAALILFPVSSLAKTKIGDLECGPGEIAKSDGTGWVCSDDLDALSQAIEEIGGFGCSATQQGNSVLITCGDGTAGVIAGAGTVVLYPEGQIGQVPPIDYNTGPVVVIDGSGVVLGETGSFAEDQFRITLDSGDSVILFNAHATQRVVLLPTNSALFFLSEDCSGPAFSNGGLFQIDNRWFIKGPGPDAALLFKSYYSDVGGWYIVDGDVQYRGPAECLAHSFVVSASSPIVEYFFAPEIANAVYPLRVEQLP